MSTPIDFEPLRVPPPRDPYPAYRQLREDAPLHQSAESGLYCLSRHRDVSFALRHPEIFSSGAMQEIITAPHQGRPRLRDLPALGRFLLRARVNPLSRKERPKGLVASDPPEHDRLRTIVNRGFTPRRVAEWEPRVRAIVADCMHGLASRGHFDVVRDLAVPLPVNVIAEMLGVEPERQIDFKHWSDAIVAGATGGTRAGGLDSFLGAMGELLAYLRRVVRARKSQPGEDLISVLLERQDEGALEEEEVFSFIMLLLVAGNETTTNLIGNAALALLAHPDQIEGLEREPAHMSGLVEETLRYDTPVQSLFRRTTRDVEVSGGIIPAGASVALLMGSANRDGEVFPEPDRFDVTRDTRAHLAFGFGIHFCLGASLARLEARVALEALLPELAQHTYTKPTPDLIDSFTVRGPRSLILSDETIC